MSRIPNFDRYYDPPEDPDDAPEATFPDGLKDGEPDSVWDFGTRQDAAFNKAPTSSHEQAAIEGLT
jgi:hypothetical protein